MTPNGIKLTTIDLPKAQRHLGLAFGKSYRIEGFKIKKIRI